MHDDTACAMGMYMCTSNKLALWPQWCMCLFYWWWFQFMVKFGTWHVSNANESLAQQQMPSGEGTQTNSDANTTVLIILCSYALLYLPTIFAHLMSMFGQSNSQFMFVVTIISVGCILANSGVNVFIYALFTNDFKIIFREIFPCSRNKINTCITLKWGNRLTR